VSFLLGVCVLVFPFQIGGNSIQKSLSPIPIDWIVFFEKSICKVDLQIFCNLCCRFPGLLAIVLFCFSLVFDSQCWTCRYIQYKHLGTVLAPSLKCFSFDKILSETVSNFPLNSNAPYREIFFSTVKYRRVHAHVKLSIASENKLQYILFYTDI